MLRQVYCCKIRTVVLTIGFVFLFVETASVLFTFYAISNAESIADSVAEWLRVRRNKFQMDEIEIIQGKNFFVERYLDFLAFPATFHILLMVSNILLLSGAVFSNRILTIPWIVMYCLKTLMILCLLIFFLVKLPTVVFKIIIFLIMSPFVIVFGFILFIVRCFYVYLRDIRLKNAMAKVYKNSELGSSFFKTQERIRRPSWAIRPPPSLWDADYLRQMDPRFNASTRSGQYPPSTEQPRKSSIFRGSSEYDEEEDIYSIDSRLEKEDSVVTLSDKFRLQEEVQVLPPIISTESSLDGISFEEDDYTDNYVKR